MPKIDVVGYGSYEVEEGTKLVLALEDHGVDVLHRCGGNARCTSCCVEVLKGDPGLMTNGELALRETRGIRDPYVRLSCQIRVRSDMQIKPIKTKRNSGMEPGPRPID